MKVIGKTTGSTTVGGQLRYAWTEQMKDFESGAYVDKPGGWKGSITDGYAVELNNNTLANGTLIELQQAGLVLGHLTWECQSIGAFTAGLTGNGTDKHLAKWNGTSALQDSATVVDASNVHTVYSQNAALTSTPAVQTNAAKSDGAGSTYAQVTLHPDGTANRGVTLRMHKDAAGGEFELGDNNGTYFWKLAVNKPDGSTLPMVELTANGSSANAYFITPSMLVAPTGLIGFGSKSGSTASVQCNVQFDNATGNVTFALGTGTTTPKFILSQNQLTPDLPRYSVNHSGTVFDGVSSTLGPGCAATGGIITSAGSGSFGTVTGVSGGTTGLTFSAGATPTMSGVLNMANGGTGAALVDPNADELLFWDDSANSVAFLVPDGTSLVITGTSFAVGTVDGGTW